MTTITQRSTLADILRELLDIKGLNVTELARQINLPQPTVQRLVTGTHTRPHAKTLTMIASFFGINERQLRGLDPIPWLHSSNTPLVRKIPILTLKEAVDWPHKTPIHTATTVTDIETSETSYAVKMPDGSMEPLIPPGALLIIDPNREPQYRSIVAVKINNCTEAFIRQLIIDTKNCYIKPLSQDFEQFTMAKLEPNDSVLGVVVEVRLHCEELRGGTPK